MQFELKKNSQKLFIDYNLPVQLNNRLSLQSKFDEQKKQSSTSKDNSFQQQQFQAAEPTSRSNSIQGRKLSFCDPQLTVSQNTLETLGNRIVSTQREKELSLQQQSQQQQYLGNPGNSQQQFYSSFVINPSMSENVLNINIPTHQNSIQQQYSLAIGRGLNPRQSKEPQKKKKRQANVTQNSNKMLQKAIKTQFKNYQMSMKKQVSPIMEERKMNANSMYQNIYEQQQQFIKGNNINSNNNNNENKRRNQQQPTSFLLTFNKDKNTSPNQNSQYGKENQKVQINLQNDQLLSFKDKKQHFLQLQDDLPDYSRKSLLHHLHSTTLQRSQSHDRKYSSPSLSSNSKTRKSQPQNYSYYLNTNHTNHHKYHAKSFIGSGEKDKDPHNHNILQTHNSASKERKIDKLVRQNIKKQKEKENKQNEIIAQQQEQLSQRKQIIEIKNKEIRDRNLKKNIIQEQMKKQKDKVHNTIEQQHQLLILEKLHSQDKDTKILIMRSQSPHKRWQILQKEKNKDMPLKVEQRRDKKQLGLEIFDLKKEMALNNQQQNNSIERPQTSQNKQNKNKQLIVKNNNNNNNIMQMKDISNIINIKKNEQRQENDLQYYEWQEGEGEKKKRKSINKNGDIQKLINKQNKKRIKKLKQEQFQELKKQQKVLQNLKILNKEIEIQRKTMKYNPTTTKSHFKTVQDSNDHDPHLQQLQNYNLNNNILQLLHFNNLPDRTSSRLTLLQHKENHSPPRKQKKKLTSRRLTIQDQNNNNTKLVKNKSSQNLPSNRVVYQYISQNNNNNNNNQEQNDENIVSNTNKKQNKSKSKSKSKNKNQKQKELNKHKLIQRLLEQIQQAKEQNKQQNDGNNNNNVEKTNNNQIQKQRDNSPQLRLKKKFLIQKNNSINQQQSQQSSKKTSPDRKKQVQNAQMQQNIQEEQSISNSNLKNPNNTYDQIAQNDQSVNMDNVQIDDEMMIFCVLTTAASIIQKNFRSYMQRKKQNLQKNLIQQEINNEYYNIKEKYEEQKEQSIQKQQIDPKRIQDNKQITNENKAQNNKNQNQRSTSESQQKKTPKHTFSFGNYDEQINSNLPLQQQSFSQLSQSIYEHNNKQQDVFNQQLSQEKGIKNNLQNLQKDYEPVQFQRLETSPIDDKKPAPTFFNQQQDQDAFSQINYKQNQPSKILIAEEVSNNKFQNLSQIQQQKEEELNNQIETNLKKVLNIGNKLKKSMVNLVQQQKHSSFLQLIKEKQIKAEKDKKREKKEKEEQLQKEKDKLKKDNMPLQKKQQQNESSTKKEKDHREQSEKKKNVLNEVQKSPQRETLQKLLEKHDLQDLEELKDDQQNYYQEVNLSRLSLEIEEDFQQQNENNNQIANKYILQNKDQNNPVQIFDHQDSLNQFYDIENDERQILKQQSNLIKPEDKIDEKNSSSSSIVKSMGEQTDKIINYSPINTNEELLEAAVNESNTLNNEDSSIMVMMMGGAVNVNLDDIQNFQSEKGGINISNSLLIEENQENQKQNTVKSQKSQSDNQENNIFGQIQQQDNAKNIQKKPMFYLDFHNNINKLERNSNQIFSHKMEDDVETDNELLLLQDDQQSYNYFQQPIASAKNSNNDHFTNITNFQNNRFSGMQQNIFSLENSNNGSAPSSYRLMTPENPYFLATNASIFEKNPLKDFTSNHLYEALENKNFKEIVKIKQEAIEFQEKIEHGYINRLEKKEVLSPKSLKQLNRRRYELEKWVSVEKKKAAQMLVRTQPLNMFEVELERGEAKRIIEQVNNKVKEIKDKIQREALERQSKSQIDTQNKNSNKGQQDLNSNKFYLQDDNINNNNNNNKSSSQKSISKLDLSEEIKEDQNYQKHLKDKQQNQQHTIQIPELDDKFMDNNEQLLKDDAPTIVLEISFDDDFDDIDDNNKLITSSQNQNQLNLIISQQEKEKQVDAITNLILTQILNDEWKIIVPIQRQNNQQLQNQLQQQQQQLLKINNKQEQQQQQNSFQEEFSFSHEIREKQQQQEIKKQLEAVELISKEEKEQNQNKQIEQNKNQNQILAQSLPNINNQKIEKIQPLIVKPQQVLEVIVHDSQSKNLNPSLLSPDNLKLYKPIGIETSLDSILDYINEIFSQIRSRSDLFLQAFATPIYKHPLEILSTLQRPDYGDLETTNNDLSNSLSCILNVQLYLTLEKARDGLIHETIEQLKRQGGLQSTINGSIVPSNQNLIQNTLSDEEFTDLISEAQHIHNKVIFDCVNEALNLVRPYGSAGEPMPWSLKARKNTMFLMDDATIIDNILKSVHSKVIQWSKTKAGALPPRYVDQSNQNQMVQVDEEFFAQQREKCLAQMLAQDLIDGEEKWLDYEMEEAQVKIDLSDIVLEHLVGEACQILNEIQKERQKNSE